MLSRDFLFDFPIPTRSIDRTAYHFGVLGGKQPGLVVHDIDGKVQSVRYLEFSVLLLNELQKQPMETRELARRLQVKDAQLTAQQREIDALKLKDASINTLSERLTALEQQARTGARIMLRSLAQN